MLSGGMGRPRSEGQARPDHSPEPPLHQGRRMANALAICLPLGFCREQLAEILIELTDRIRISAE